MPRGLVSKLCLLLVNALIVYLLSLLVGAGVGVLSAQPPVTLRNTFGAIHKVTTGGGGKVTGTHAFITTPSKLLARV